MSENNEFCYLLPYVKEDIFMMQASAWAEQARQSYHGTAGGR
jgi:hypothetical protein